MEFEEFLEKMELRKVREGIFEGVNGYYRLLPWSKNFRNREIPKNELSQVSPQNLPREEEVRIYKRIGGSAFVEYIFLEKISDESIRRFRGQIEDRLRKMDFPSLLTAAEGIGKSKVRQFFPDLWPR